MYQNNTGLPFDAAQLQYQPVSINPQQPPFVPNVSVEPNFASYLPYIAGTAAAVINATAGNNPLRVFLFNQMVNNQYRTEPFADLVATVVNWLAVESDKGTVNTGNIAQLIQQMTEKCVEFFAAFNTQIYPALVGAIDPTTMQVIVQQVLPEYQNLSNVINQRLQMKMQAAQGYQQPVQNGWQQPQRPQYQQNVRQPVNTISQPQQVQTGRFANTQSVQQLQTPMSHRGNASVLKAPVVNQPIINQPIIQTPSPVQNVRPTEWAPSKEHRFAPTYCASKQFATMEYDTRGNVVIKLRDRETEMFDQGAHQIHNPLNMPVKNRTIEQIRAESRQLLLAAKEYNKPEVNEPTVDAVSGLSIDHQKRDVHPFPSTSVELALIKGDAERYKYLDENGKLPDLHRIVVDITSPLFAKPRDTAALVTLSNCDTYQEVKDVLGHLKAVATKRFVFECEKRMTDMINRQLKQNLGFDEEQITTFSDDIDELVEYIKDAYGEETQKAFLRRQTKSIRALFKVIEPEVWETLKESFDNMIDESVPEQYHPSVLFVTNRHCYTYLNRDLDQLDLGVVTVDLPSRIDSTNTPALYEIAKGIFDEMQQNGWHYFRNFLKLEDGHVFELTNGFIGDDAFILTMMK